MDSLEQKQKALYEEYSAQIKSADVVQAAKLFRHYLSASTKLDPRFSQLTEEEQLSIIKHLE